MPSPNDVQRTITKFAISQDAGSGEPHGVRLVIKLTGEADHSGHESTPGFVWFYEGERTIPPNYLTFDQGAQMQLPFKIAASVLQLLRRLNTLTLAHSLDGREAYLVTGHVPVGCRRQD